ncbi:MAG: DUF1553 domain-containing protein [Planctomycetota bacterium]|nr:DUF1553 domain-containing protein [Planctomycetota bacterium]
MWQLLLTLTCWLSVAVGTVAADDQQRVSFARDVMPMSTKLGCNTTACHNVLTGKGGLKLSPLGSDYSADYRALARSNAGRLVSPIDPDSSLLLKRLSGPKSTVKLEHDSEAYRTFRNWMANGAKGPNAADARVVDLKTSTSRVVLLKGDSSEIQVTARWSDGVIRDVTRWCRFEIEDDAIAEVSGTGKITAKQHAEWGVDDFQGIAAAFNDHADRSSQQKLVQPSVFGLRLGTDGQDTREQLAVWLIGEGRMMLARNIVHRYWNHFFGQSLTMWVDDLTPSSGERHAGLLDYLTKELVEHEFDVKHIIRLMCGSRVYQLGNSPVREPVEQWFASRFTPIRMTDSGLLDVMRIAAGSRKGQEKGMRAARPKMNMEGDDECSRNQYRSWGAPVYRLFLTNSEELTEMLRDPDGIASRLVKGDASTDEISERMFFRVLHRKPTDKEWQQIRAHAAKTERAAYVEDVFWALLNTKEFLFIH